MISVRYAKRYDGTANEAPISEIFENLSANLGVVLSESDKVVKLVIPHGELYHRCSPEEWENLFEYLTKNLQFDVRTALSRDRKGKSLSRVAYPVGLVLAGVAIVASPTVTAVILGFLAATVVVYWSIAYLQKLLVPPTPNLHSYWNASIVGAIWLIGIAWLLIRGKLTSPAFWVEDDTLILIFFILSPLVVLFFKATFPELRWSWKARQLK